MVSWTNQPASTLPRQIDPESLRDGDALLSPSPESYYPTGSASLDSAPIPKQLRLLGDGRGKSCKLNGRIEHFPITYLTV